MAPRFGSLISVNSTASDRSYQRVATGVCPDLLVRRQQRHARIQSLTNQHSIEWVAMPRRKRGQSKHSRVLQWQRLNEPLIACLCHQNCNRNTARQLAQLIFDQQFPDRNGAENNFVRGIVERLCSQLRKGGSNRWRSTRTSRCRAATSRRFPLAFKELKRICGERFKKSIG